MVQRLYDASSEVYGRLYASEQESKILALRRMLAMPWGITLDVGCGTGLSIQDRPGRKACVGIDISLKMLQIASARKEYLVQADALNLPFRQEAFDTITLITSFHHLPQKTRFLAQITLVLKGQGSLVVSLLKVGGWHHQLSTLKASKRFSLVAEGEEDKDYLLVLRKKTGSDFAL